MIGGLVTVGCILITSGFGWWRCTKQRPPLGVLVRGVV